MKVAHVVTLVSASGAYGGPVSVALRQVESLAERGHDVSLLAGWDGRAQPTLCHDVSVKLFRTRQLVPGMGFSGLWTPALARHLARTIVQYDIVHIHLARDLVTLGAAHTARVRRQPYVVQPHGMIVPDARFRATVTDRVATRKVLTSAKRVFFLTGSEREALLSVGATSLSLRHLVNGVPASGPVRRESHGKRPEVLFCARLHPVKRVSIFVDMAIELVARGLDATFVAAGPDQGELGLLRQRVKECSGLNGKLTYEGPISPDDMAERLARASVYVLPSLNEAFPMGVLEAMAAGTPAVLTQGCQIASQLARYRAAVITDGSVNGLADGVEELITKPSLRDEIRANALRAVNSTFSIDAVARQLESEYSTACETSNNRAAISPDLG